MSITKLSLKNFTVFEEAEFSLAPGINVLIGENGTGKTHVLKALYAVTKVLPDGAPNWATANGFSSVFGYASLDGRHLPRNRTSGRHAELIISAGTQSIELHLDGAPSKWRDRGLTSFPRPVFIPSREILSVFPGFAEANRNRELAFDATYLDLADALALTPLKGEALVKQQPLLDLVEAALGGREEEEGGAFYVTFDGDRFEAQLVAEGLRKVAQVARLIRNGRIAPGTLLLWDRARGEPQPGAASQGDRRPARAGPSGRPDRPGDSRLPAFPDALAARGASTGRNAVDALLRAGARARRSGSGDGGGHPHRH